MGYYHRWEEFPEFTAYYLKENPDCAGIKSRKIATDRMMVSNIRVKGGAKIPRHYHEAEQIVLIHKGLARVTTGDKKVHTLGPGGIWVVPSNVVHSVQYVGMIGSGKKIQTLYSNLRKKGISQEKLKKVHAPIGLDIGAETPEEIAVSIVAEMIQVKRKG